MYSLEDFIKYGGKHLPEITVRTDGFERVKTVSPFTHRDFALIRVPVGHTKERFLKNVREPCEFAGFSHAHHLLRHPYLFKRLCDRYKEGGDVFRIDFIGTTAVQKSHVPVFFHPSLVKNEGAQVFELTWVRDFHCSQYVCMMQKPPR